MKKLLFLALPLLFIGCNNDDDNDATIVGTWRLDRDTESVDGEVVYEDNYEDVADCKPVVVFNADGSYTASTFDEDCMLEDFVTGTYALNGNVLTIISTNSEFPEEGEETDEVIVEELTANSLVAKSEYYDDWEFEANVIVRNYFTRVE